MAARSHILNIRYVVDVTDHGTKELLAANRKVRTSAEQTGAALTAQGRRATAAAQQTERAAGRAAGVHRRNAVQLEKVARSYGQVNRAASRAASAERRAASGRRASSTAARGQVKGAIGGAVGSGMMPGRIRATIDGTRNIVNRAMGRTGKDGGAAFAANVASTAASAVPTQMRSKKAGWLSAGTATGKAMGNATASSAAIVVATSLPARLKGKMAGMRGKLGGLGRAVGVEMLATNAMNAMNVAATAPDLNFGQKVQRAASVATLGLYPDARSVDERVAEIAKKIQEHKGQLTLDDVAKKNQSFWDRLKSGSRVWSDYSKDQQVALRGMIAAHNVSDRFGRSLRRMSRQNDIAGMKRLAAQAHDLAGRAGFPEARRAYNDFARSVSAGARDLDRRFGAMKANAFVASWKAQLAVAGQITPRYVERIVKGFDKLPPGVRRRSARSMVEMARELEAKGKLPIGSAEALAAAINGKLSAINRRTRRIARNLGEDLGGAFDGLRDKLGGALDDVKTKIADVGSSVGGLAGRVLGILDGGDPPPPRRKPKRKRKGGIAGYQRGGTVPALVSSGELIEEPGGRSWTVPGQRVAADNVYAELPIGAKVYTDHGQMLRAAGYSASETLAMQMPHFRSGGIASLNRSFKGNSGFTMSSNTVRRVAELSGWSPRDAYGADVLADRESKRKPGIENATGDGGIGLMQNTPYLLLKGGKPNWGPAALSYMKKIGGVDALYNPFGNMRMAKYLLDHGGWSHWSASGPPPGTPANVTSALTPGDRRLKGIGVNMAGGGRGRTKTTLSFAERLPSARASWAGGYQTGIEGGNLWGSDTARQARAAGSTKLKVERIAGRSARGRSSGRANFTPGDGWGGSQALVMRAIRGFHPTYSGYTASYKRPNNSGNGISDHWVASKNAFAADIAPGDGVFNTVRRRLGINAAKGSWNKFDNKPVNGYRSQLLWHAPDGSHKDHNHLGIRKMRNGGVIRHFRTGGQSKLKIGGKRVFGDAGLGDLRELKVTDNVKFREQLRGFARMIDKLDDVGVQIVKARLRDISRVVTKIQRGGVKKGERTKLRSLRGERAQLRNDLEVTPSYAKLEKVEKGLQRQIRRVRRGGVDGGGERTTLRRLQAAMRVTQTELGRRTGLIVQGVEKQGAVLERDSNYVTQRLRHDNIDEASAQGVAAMRDLAATQRDKLTAMSDKLTTALARARRRGDRGAVADISERLDGVRDQLAETVTNWVELGRQAVQAQYQRGIDVSAHRSSMASTGLERLELEQRIAGTYDSGGQARADYIRKTIMPGIQAEIDALNAQYANAQLSEAEREANREAVAQKTNELLSQQVEATEQVAANTEPLKEFASSRTFEFGGQMYTDRDIFSPMVGG